MTVKTISTEKYIAALMTWIVVAYRGPVEREQMVVACEALRNHFGNVEQHPGVFCKFMGQHGPWSIDLEKSCLLARLIYAQEPLRMRRCPLHKGRWSGCGRECPHGCYFGSNVTGWLPEKPFEPSTKKKEKSMVDLNNWPGSVRGERNPFVEKVCPFCGLWWCVVPQLPKDQPLMLSQDGAVIIGECT